MAEWFPPYGLTCKRHHFDATQGGSSRMSFTNFPSGDSHAFGGEYRELVPHTCLRYSDKFGRSRWRSWPGWWSAG